MPAPALTKQQNKLAHLSRHLYLSLNSVDVMDVGSNGEGAITRHAIADHILAALELVPDLWDGVE